MVVSSRLNVTEGGDEGVVRVLIIDDDEQLCRTLRKFINRLDMKADCATTLEKGMEKTETSRYDIVFLDVNLPDGIGIDIIPQLSDTRSSPEIIILTGYGDENGAELAIRNGAWDYIQKGSSFQEIKLSLDRAVKYRQQKAEKKTRLVLNRENIVGNSKSITQCLGLVAQAANSSTPVLISGETGTGKELFARAIHDNRPRASGAFVVVDCSALPEHLVEGILFGHKKGAFTGAATDSEGLIRQADEGTLFLDEIGELPMGIQKKFLRVLQEKRFRPIGGKQEIHSNFRFVSATNRDLSNMVEEGLFRQDLYYRIKSIQIKLPPLRERKEDIPALVMSHINRSCTLFGERPHGVSPDFLEALQVCQWPGNVRELFNVIDSVLAETSEEPVLFMKHLPTYIRTYAARSKVIQNGAASSPSPGNKNYSQNMLPLKIYIEKMKTNYLKNLMNMTKGDVRFACTVSGLSRGHLYELLKKYNIR